MHMYSENVLGPTILMDVIEYPGNIAIHNFECN